MPSWFINRELSWLDFNERVLEEARDPSNPLLERLRFLAICASNLDEFFEVRVAGLQAQLYENLEPQDPPPDGMGPLAQLIEISRRAHDFVGRLYEVWRTEVRPQLLKHGIRVCSPPELSEPQDAYLDEFFDSQVYPVLTPLAIDPAHPFPHVHNKSLNLLLADRVRQVARPAAVRGAPGPLGAQPAGPAPRRGRRPAAVRPAGGRDRPAARRSVRRLPGHRAGRLPRHPQQRPDDPGERGPQQPALDDRGDAAPAQVGGRGAAGDLRPRRRSFLAQLLSASALELEERDVYKVPGPVDLTALAGLWKLEGFRDLREPPYEPQMPAVLASRKSVFTAIRDQDILVHHPYESFGTVVQFIEQASEDPGVLAIKMTLYRTADANPIINALARAAENGKQVTALVELQARLDEENNIDKARMLQKAGVHVVYGIVGLKTHCKAALVVRREHDGIKRYVHLGTGNYNPTTARMYTDLSFFTCRAEFGEDASALFNLLTGYSQGNEWNRLIIAPKHLANRLLALIDRERVHAEEGRPARIIAKINSLVDPKAIEALYRASQAGVRIDLIVRGICCLRPRLPGVSDNIRVISIVDKYLEHSRIAYFQNGDDPEVFLASADWMPRNFRRRVEIMFPIEALPLRRRLVDGILGVLLADNVKARELQPDGTYRRVRPPGPGEPTIRSQVEFQNMAIEACETSPISHPATALGVSAGT